MSEAADRAVAAAPARALVDKGFALWALVLGLVGALGSTLHGGHDLANLANRPEIATSGPSPFAVVLGFLVNPAWHAWLGATLLRGSAR